MLEEGDQPILSQLSRIYGYQGASKVSNDAIRTQQQSKKSPNVPKLKAQDNRTQGSDAKPKAKPVEKQNAEKHTPNQLRAKKQKRQNLSRKTQAAKNHGFAR